MQRGDRCILRNRMARIPCTLRVPTPHPERVLCATFESFHKKPSSRCYLSRSMYVPSDAPSAYAHLILLDLPTLRRCCPFQHCRCGGEFDFEPRRCPGRDCIRCRVNRIARRTFTFRIHGAHLDRVLCVRLELCYPMCCVCAACCDPLSFPATRLL